MRTALVLTAVALAGCTARDPAGTTGSAAMIVSATT